MNNYFSEPSGHLIIDNVYCKFHIADKRKPVVITFAGAGDFVRTQHAQKGVAPWGFDFVKKHSGNVISFAAIDVSNWYRSKEFESFIDHVAAFISEFPQRFGYGGSMGGFGISAFSNKLNLDRVLLINPISTLSKTEVPWERRFSWASRYDWSEGNYDGRHVNAPGYVVYDPLHSFDKLHAFRYKENITHLRVYGVGHSMARHLQSMGMLKKLYVDFINDSIDQHEFYIQARARKQIDQYFKRQLAPFNKRLTPARTEILTKYRAKLKRKQFLKAHGDIKSDSTPVVNMVFKATLSGGSKEINARCNDALLRIGAQSVSGGFWSSWDRGAAFIKNGGLKLYGRGYLDTIMQMEKIVVQGNFDTTKSSNGFLLGFLSSLKKDIGTVLIPSRFNLKNIDGLSPEQLQRIHEFRQSMSK